MTVSNSTFSGNSATLWRRRHLQSTATLTLKNTIVANSPTGGNCSGAITDGGGNLSYPDTTCPGINADPCSAHCRTTAAPPRRWRLAQAARRLTQRIDAICAAAPVNSLDQRGITRPQGPHCDIGAVEQVPPQEYVASHCAFSVTISCDSAARITTTPTGRPGQRHRLDGGGPYDQGPARLVIVNMKRPASHRARASLVRPAPWLGGPTPNSARYRAKWVYTESSPHLVRAWTVWISSRGKGYRTCEPNTSLASLSCWRLLCRHRPRTPAASSRLRRSPPAGGAGRRRHGDVHVQRHDHLDSTIMIAADTTIDGSGQTVTISGNQAGAGVQCEHRGYAQPE